MKTGLIALFAAVGVGAGLAGTAVAPPPPPIFKFGKDFQTCSMAVIAYVPWGLSGDSPSTVNAEKSCGTTTYVVAYGGPWK